MKSEEGGSDNSDEEDGSDDDDEEGEGKEKRETVCLKGMTKEEKKAHKARVKE